jgi:competence protein ComEC
LDLSARLWTAFSRQAERAFLWAVVAFAAGIALFFTWKTDPAFWFPAAPCAVGALILVFAKAIPGARFVGLLFIALGLGHGAAQLRTWAVATPMLERDTRRVEITGLVTAAERRAAGNRIVLKPESIPGIAPERTPRYLRISIPSGHGLPRVGDAVTVPAVVGPPALPVAPGAFEFQRYLYFARIGGTGYSVGRWAAVSAASELTWQASFLSTVEAWRRAIGQRIAGILPGPEGTVVTALVNGEQGAIPEDLQDAYRAAGIAHFLSISGLHMTLLAGVVFFAVRRGLALFPVIALRIDTKKCAAWAGLATTAFYLLISGMSLPAVRAFMMIAVVMVAVLLDRTALSMRTVAWAALVLMTAFPEALFGASFQMSFLAVLALVALYEQAWLRVTWRSADGGINLARMAWLYIAGLIATDIAAGGATSLFAAYHFNRLPTYSVISNLATVPLTGFWIMPAAIVGLILMPFGWDIWAFRVMGEGVKILNDVAYMTSSWPHAQVLVPVMAPWAMALGALGIVFVCIWKGRARWIGFIGLIPAFVQPITSAPPDVIVDDSARVFAVADMNGGLMMRPGRSGRFIREVWAERYGTSDRPWPKLGVPDEGLGLSCDGDGCILVRDDKKLLLAFTATALAEDCGAVDAVISGVAARDLCRKGTIVDIIDLRRKGTHAVWLTEDGVRVLTVKDVTGDRVWMRGVVREDIEVGEEVPTDQ